MREDDPSQQAVGEEMVAEMRRRIYRALTTDGVIVKGEIDFENLIRTREMQEIGKVLIDSDEETRGTTAIALFGAAVDEMLGWVKEVSKAKSLPYMHVLRSAAK